MEKSLGKNTLQNCDMALMNVFLTDVGTAAVHS